MRDAIFYHGDILTMDRKSMPEAILVQNGKIAKLGDRHQLRAISRGAEEIDLKGGCLMPAFLDAHSHISALASTLGLATLEQADSFDELAERMRRYRNENGTPEGEWLVGFGYDHNALKERSHPTRQLLDSIATDIPIMVTHKSGHMGVLNTRALQLVGIKKDTPDPPGGKIGRQDDGEPNGYLEEAAFIRLAAAMPKPSKDRQLQLLEKAQQVYLSYGITTVQDGLTGPDEFELLRAGAEANMWKVDVVCYADMKKAPLLANEHSDRVGRYRSRLKIGGYKLILDGSPQGRTAWLSEPYEKAEDGYRGYPVYQDDELLTLVERVQTERMQLLAHCNGDAASEQFIRCYAQALERTGQTGLRPVMIHAQTVRPDQLREMAVLNMIPSFFVSHTYEWGDAHIANLGRTRAERISPVRSAADYGLCYTFHQDTPVLPPDMLESVWCAANRVTKNGTRLGEDQCVTAYEALQAITSHAAYQYFEEGSKGSISEGKLADFVVLDRNPLMAAPEKLREISICRTIKEGKTVFVA